MPGRYVVRTRDGSLATFYWTDDGTISFRKYENSIWGTEELLVEDVRNNFTVNIAENGNVYLFCQDSGGSIILCMRSSGDWKTKEILSAATDNIQMAQFSALITDNIFCALYNVGGQLVTRQLDKNGSWHVPVQIDGYANMADIPFALHNTSAGHAVLFYLTPDNNLVYRELTQNRYGSLNIVYQATGQIMDVSFVAAHDAVHFLFVVKNLFSSQLIYRKKDAGGFGNIIVLWEGQRFENCMIFRVKNTLYVTYIINDQLYYVTSGDNGGTFTRPSRYRDKFPRGIRKAVYVSDDYEQAEFFCHDIYVDRNNTVILLPTLYDGFYPNPEDKRISTYEKSIVESSYDEEMTNKMAMLQNRYNIAKKRLEEKDHQIMELTKSVKTRNDELITSNNDWKRKYKKLMQEYDELTNKRKGDFFMNNSVLDTIATRSSVRAFTSQQPTKEQLDALINAALAAPSGMNSQPWKLIVVSGKEMLLDIEKACFEAFEKKEMHQIIDRLNSRGGTVFYNAPIVMFIAIKNDAKLDAGIMVQNIALAAKSIGLDSCIIGLTSFIFGDGVWEERLQFPEGYTYGMSIAVGYAEKEFKPHEIDTSKVVMLLNS